MVATLPPAVSEAARGVVEVRAESSQPVALPVEGPPTRVAAAQEQEDKVYEQNTAARSLPIVVAES